MMMMMMMILYKKQKDINTCELLKAKRGWSAEKKREGRILTSENMRQ